MKTLLAVLTITACAILADAGSTQIWEQKNVEDFERGETSNVSITSDGKLQLSPPADLAFETGDPYVWALARDSRGRIFVAGGNEGKVHVFAPSPQPSATRPGSGNLFFKANEIEVHALAVDSADNLYVGSSPDGKVYRVKPDGSSSVFFDPKAKYIWSMVFDGRGNLYVATGDRGELFKVDSQGRGTVAYKSADKHIRSLCALGADAIVAGTEGRGRIIRISSDGSAFVLFDAPVREITSVAAGADGAIYAAGIGVRSQRPSAPSIRSVQSTGMPIEVSGTLERVSQLLNEGRPQRSDPSIDAEGSEVYRIAADGQPKTIWKSDKVTAFSVAAVGDGSALVGTGSQGNIYKVRAEPPAASVLMRAAGSQVTALLHDAQGRIIYAGTSNLGRLYRAGAGYASRGSYESQVKDAGIFSKWGTLRWRQETPGGTSVKVYTRSGNTQEPDSTWSPWSEPLTQASGQKVTSPAARFFQWKAELQSGASDATPTIDNVEVAYLPRNVAPEINAVVLHQKDLAIERLPVFQDQQGLGQLSAITQVSQPGAASSASAPEPPMRQRPVPSRTSLKRGWQSMSWDARDDNGDQLVYSVYIKGEGESEWKLLKDRVEETFFSWDTTNFPDGAYTLKLAAADSPANPPDVTLIAERISDRFYIDNTAPVLSGLTASPEPGGRIRIRARANDSATWLSKAEFGVDGGELRQVFPIDGLFDSETEELDFVITNLSAGEHTIVVRVADRGNNYGSSKQIVTVR